MLLLWGNSASSIVVVVIMWALLSISILPTRGWRIPPPGVQRMCMSLSSTKSSSTASPASSKKTLRLVKAPKSCNKRSSKAAAGRLPIITGEEEEQGEGEAEEVKLEPIPVAPNKRKKRRDASSPPEKLRFYMLPTKEIAPCSVSNIAMNHVISNSMTSCVGSSIGSNASQELMFTVYGEPMALARHRSTKFGTMYNPCAKFQKQFLDASIPFLPTTPLTGALEARVNFYLPRPKNHFGTGKNENVLRPDAPYWPTKRLDIDNLVKFVFDALNGKAYEDDTQIAIVMAGKYYMEGEGRTEVTLKCIE